MNTFFSNLENEYVDLAGKVVSFRSYPGQEKELADFFLARFAEMNAEAFRDGAGNIVAIIRGDSGPSVMLNGHLDIVPEGDLANWVPFDPFVATRDGSDLIGRGLSDLKGGLCAQYLAFKLVKKAVDSGIKLHGTLIFSLVVMEEPAESMGMEYLLETTFPEHGLHCDVVYLCEPTSGDVALGQRGKVELAVSVRGKCAHSSRPEEGINAVQKALPVLDAIFSGFNEAPVTHPRLGSSSMTVTDLKVSPGGLSVVPDLCEISLDRRYVPPQTIDDTVFQVQALLDKLAAADPEFSASVAPRSTHRRCYTGYEKDMPKRHPAWETARDNNFVLATLEALRAVGLPCDEKYWQFGTDGSVSAGGYGIPTIGYSHARESWAHQPKERVCIDDMLCSVEGYSAILCKLFALPLDDVISSNK